MNFPILSSLILLPSIGALFILISRSSNKSNFQIYKYVALFVSFGNFFLSIYLWYIFDSNISDFQFVEERLWIKGFINYKPVINIHKNSILIKTEYNRNTLSKDIINKIENIYHNILTVR